MWKANQRNARLNRAWLDKADGSPHNLPLKFAVQQPSTCRGFQVGGRRRGEMHVTAQVPQAKYDPSIVKLLPLTDCLFRAKLYYMCE
jgi:hypothetical protein